MANKIVVDELQILVKADTTDATRKLSNLTSVLERLQNISLRNTRTQIEGIARSFAGLKGLDSALKHIRDLSESLKTLQKLDLTKTESQVRSMADTISRLHGSYGLDQGLQRIQSMRWEIDKLSEAVTRLNSTKLTGFSGRIQTVVAAMEQAAETATTAMQEITSSTQPSVRHRLGRVGAAGSTVRHRLGRTGGAQVEQASRSVMQTSGVIRSAVELSQEARAYMEAASKAADVVRSQKFKSQEDKDTAVQKAMRNAGDQAIEAYAEQKAYGQATLSIGENVAEGIAEGMTRVDFMTFAKKVADNIETALRDALQTHSPSLRMIPIGEDIVAGIIEGMLAGTSRVFAVTGVVLDQIANGVRSFASTIGPAFLNLGSVIARGVASGFSLLIDLGNRIREIMWNIVQLVANTLVRVFQTLGNVLEGIVNLHKQIAIHAVDLAKNIANAAARAVELANTLIGKILPALKRAGMAIATFTLSPLIEAGKHIQSLYKSVNRLFARIKGIAFQRLIRTLIREVGKAFQEGITNLYHFSEQIGTPFASAMDALSTRMQTLQNSIAAAVSPIIEYFIPYITAATQAVINLLNPLNQLFSALSGKTTWYMAVDTMKAFDEETKKTAKSAKDAEKAVKGLLADWDELNIIQSKNSDSSGSGSGSGSGNATDYSKMFKLMEIDSPIVDFAQLIRDKILAGDWGDVGRILAQKLNQLVDSLDTYSWGQQLAKGVNNALHLAFVFLGNFDFRKLGGKVADLLNAALREIEFETLGRTIA